MGKRLTVNIDWRVEMDREFEDTPAPTAHLRIATATIGYAASTVWLLFVAVSAAGFFVVGVAVNLNPIAASVYPTAIRSTAVGRSLGMKSIGGIVGALVGSVLVSLNLDLESLYLAAAAPITIGAASLVNKFREVRRRRRYRHLPQLFSRFSGQSLPPAGPETTAYPTASEGKLLKLYGGNSAAIAPHKAVLKVHGNDASFPGFDCMAMRASAGLLGAEDMREPRSLSYDRRHTCRHSGVLKRPSRQPRPCPQGCGGVTVIWEC